MEGTKQDRRAYYRARRAALVAAGTCPRCGVAPVAEGKKGCPSCLAEGSHNAAAARASLSSEEKRYQSRERRRKARAETLRDRAEVAAEVLNETRERLYEALAKRREAT